MLKIDYFSDVLCVWAWIAQVRNEQLLQDYPNDVALSAKFMNLFGDTTQRIGEGWKARGGFAAFADHVSQAVENYPDAPVSADVWRRVRPRSSMPAQLFLAAIRQLHGDSAVMDASKVLRRAFFVDAVDIGQQNILSELLAAQFDVVSIATSIASGQAFAALASDYQLAEKQRLQGSPTWLLNDGRQTLFGNVGYRVLSANVEQLLKHPAGEASWC